MRVKKVKGMISTLTPLHMELSNVIIRVEKTEKIKGKKVNFTTVSLEDEKRGIMIQVNYDDIKKLIKEL